jgi:hypothetical protein
MVAGLGVVSVFSFGPTRPAHGVNEGGWFPLNHFGVSPMPDQPEAAGPLPPHGEDGTTPDLRTTIYGVSAFPDRLTADAMRFMLEQACKFLGQVTHLTSCVLETVRLDDVRELFAGDIPLGPQVIRINGTMRDDPAASKAPPEPGQDPSTGSGQDHRKKPRGRTHPLMALLKLAAQASRLLKQIGAGLFPEAHNQLTADQKMQLETQKLENEWQRLQLRRPYMSMA